MVSNATGRAFGLRSWSSPTEASQSGTSAMSCSLDRDVLERRGKREARDQSEGRLANPRTDPAQKGELPDRRVHRLFVNELLHLIQDRPALTFVELVGLQRVELVDVGIAAVDVGAALDHEGSEPGGGIAKGGACSEDDAVELFVG